MTPLPLEIKTLIVTTLALEGVAPESIDDDAPLFGEGLGLDSIDACLLYTSDAADERAFV
jgi:acyl carrier protein